jgi:hypothetical protein
MTTVQRWVTAIAVALILLLGIVFAMVATHSRVGSLPPNLPPLPCGHAVLTSTQFGGMTKVTCIRGEIWFHSRAGWTQSPPIEQALPTPPTK